MSTGRPSSLHLPRLEGPGRLRVLRVRAEDLGAMVTHHGAATVITVTTRDRLALGERVVVEVALGAMVDEVALSAEVTSVEPCGPGLRRRVGLSVQSLDVPRLGYLLDVHAGRRTPFPRRHRRVPVALPVRWFHGFHPCHGTARSLSLGGAFIETQVSPQEGYLLELEIRGDTTTRGPLVLPARVAWQGMLGPYPGFGVAFRGRSPAAATKLGALVRTWERTVGRDAVTLGRLPA